MKNSHSQSRREFLKIAATVGAGFAIGIQLSSCNDNNGEQLGSHSENRFIPNIWFEILENNRIICFFAEAEMGQAVATSLPLILAEELGADWDLVEVRHAPITPPYGEQSTGGSTSIRQNWQSLRQAGAMAREMMIKAARLHFNNVTDPFDTENSWIVNLRSGERVKFGAVVNLAQELQLPEKAEPRVPGTYKLIGHSPLPSYSKEKLTGELFYASDIQLADMVYATIVHPPIFGSRYESHNEYPATNAEGYIDSFLIEEGLAVIATNTWAAFKAAQLIKVIWSESRHAGLSSNDLYEKMGEVGSQQGKILLEEGLDEREPEASGITSLEKVYTTPFQAHATMEPMCCVAYIHDGICEVWAPTQKPTDARSVAKNIYYSFLRRVAAKISTILDEDGDPYPDITIHPQFLGGGFGRRLKNDYVSECVQIAAKIKHPVKLQWSREQDIRHDFYRATSRHQMLARLDKTSGKILHWSHKIISPSISSIRIPYSISSQLVTAAEIETPVPLGPWRSVNNSNNIYAVECFFDEIAYDLGRDPVDLRLSLLDKEPRLRSTLAKAQEMAVRLQDNRSTLGCAIFKGYGSYIAVLTEIHNIDNPTIRRMTAVVDCGLVIDPGQAKAQVEGGLIFALTAATQSEITINRGHVEQSNFNDFPLLSLQQTPEFHVSFINSNESPGGLGEVPIPPVAPSVHNAIQRLRGRQHPSTNSSATMGAVPRPEGDADEDVIPNSGRFSVDSGQ